MRGLPAMMRLRTTFFSASWNSASICAGVQVLPSRAVSSATHCFFSSADLRVANLLLGDAVSVGDGRDELGDARSQGLVLDGRRPDDRRTAGLFGQRTNRFDRNLHLLVAEHHGAEHDVFRQPVGLRLHHEHGLLRAGDDEVELRLFQLRARRIQQVLTVLVADARGADRPHERQARQRERRGRAEQRRDVGIDLRVHRQHGRNDLHVAPVACGEQRANRPIDEARSQRLLLARSAFALEEAAGDLAGRVGLFLIVDGQREEVASRDVLLVADRRHEDDGVRHVDEHGAVGLPGDDAGFDRDVMGTVLEGSASSHVGFLGKNARQEAPTSGS